MASQRTLEVQDIRKTPIGWRLVSGFFIATAGFLGVMAIYFWSVNLQNEVVPEGFPTTSPVSGAMYLLLALLALARHFGYSKTPSLIGLSLAAIAAVIVIDQIFLIDRPDSQSLLAPHLTFWAGEDIFPSVLTAAALFALGLSYSLTSPRGPAANVWSLFLSYVALLVPFAATYGYLLTRPNFYMFGNHSGVSIWSAIALTSLAIAQLMIASNHSLKRFKQIALANPFKIR